MVDQAQIQATCQRINQAQSAAREASHAWEDEPPLLQQIIVQLLTEKALAAAGDDIDMKDLARMAGIILKLAQARALTSKHRAAEDSTQKTEDSKAENTPGLSPELAEEIRHKIMGQA